MVFPLIKVVSLARIIPTRAVYYSIHAAARPGTPIDCRTLVKSDEPGTFKHEINGSGAWWSKWEKLGEKWRNYGKIGTKMGALWEIRGIRGVAGEKVGRARSASVPSGQP